MSDMENSSHLYEAGRSPFALALTRLLDETGYFTRSEWAAFLGISTSAISQWVKDKTVPRADLLRMILNLLRSRAGGAATEPLAHFAAISLRPAQEISPLAGRIAPSIEAYLAKPSFAAFADSLSDMAPDRQRSLLAEGSWIEDAPDVDQAVSTPRVWTTWRSFDRRACDFQMPSRLRRTHVKRGAGVDQAWTAVLKQPRSLVVGTPGSGKSWGLNMLAARLREQTGRAPEVIHAGRLAERPLSLGVETGAPHIVGPILFIDGFDEVPADRRRALGIELVEHLKRVPTTRVVLASRPTPELDLFEDFQTFEVAPLTDMDMVVTLTRAADAQADASESWIDVSRFLCHLSERDALREPLRNPMFLKRAWSLYQQNRVTPFFESEIVSECVRSLLEWDHIKGLIRVRQPWASRQRLSALLGELAFLMLRSSKVEFSVQHFQKCVARHVHTSNMDEVLELLLIQGVLGRSGDAVHFAHRTMQSYFAANYVVESTDSAAGYLEGWTEREDLREVLRLACGITNDATSLLRSVLDTKVAGVARYVLLAQILSQPISAEAAVMEDSCDVVVGWLDGELEDWSVQSPTMSPTDEASPSWRMCATTTGGMEPGEPVRSALLAIHRARSGPAYAPFKARLAETKSPLLPHFGDSMDVDGLLDLSFVTHDHDAGLLATVREPQLN